jgi:hypothetical protein
VSARSPVVEMTSSAAGMRPTDSSKVRRTSAGSLFTLDPSTGLLLTSTACALAAGAQIRPATSSPPTRASTQATIRVPVPDRMAERAITLTA